MCSNCIFNSFNLFLLFVCFSFTPWNVAVVARFGVVFLAQKSPSTSWIVTYHVFIAGFPFPDILNDWVLSISLWYEHFSHDTGVTTCPLFEAVIESWQQLIPKQAMTPQLVTLSCNLVTQKIQTTQKIEDDAQSDSSEKGYFIEHSYEALFVPDTDVECVIVHSK